MLYVCKQLYIYIEKCCFIHFKPGNKVKQNFSKTKLNKFVLL